MIASAAFNELVLHDINWGYFNVPYAHTYDNIYTEAIMSRGLPFINKIALASTYAERAQLFDTRIFPSPSRSFLQASFRQYNMERSSRLGQLDAELPPPDLATGEPPQILPIWDLSHGRHYHTIEGPPSYPPYRTCGYLFWDGERWEISGPSLQDWLLDHEMSAAHLPADNGPSLEALNQSYKERTRLYRQGCRGYWEGNWKAAKSRELADICS